VEVGKVLKTDALDCLKPSLVRFQQVFYLPDSAGTSGKCSLLLRRYQIIEISSISGKPQTVRFVWTETS
jgi:hypothetical protein